MQPLTKGLIAGGATAVAATPLVSLLAERTHAPLPGAASLRAPIAAGGSLLAVALARRGNVLGAGAAAGVAAASLLSLPLHVGRHAHAGVRSLQSVDPRTGGADPTGTGATGAGASGSASGTTGAGAPTAVSGTPLNPASPFGDTGATDPFAPNGTLYPIPPAPPVHHGTLDGLGGRRTLDDPLRDAARRARIEAGRPTPADVARTIVFQHDGDDRGTAIELVRGEGAPNAAGAYWNWDAVETARGNTPDGVVTLQELTRFVATFDRNNDGRIAGGEAIALNKTFERPAPAPDLGTVVDGKLVVRSSDTRGATISVDPTLPVAHERYGRTVSAPDVPAGQAFIDASVPAQRRVGHFVEDPEAPDGIAWRDDAPDTYNPDGGGLFLYNDEQTGQRRYEWFYPFDRGTAEQDAADRMITPKPGLTRYHDVATGASWLEYAAPVEAAVDPLPAPGAPVAPAAPSAPTVPGSQPAVLPPTT